MPNFQPFSSGRNGCTTGGGGSGGSPSGKFWLFTVVTGEYSDADAMTLHSTRPILVDDSWA